MISAGSVVVDRQKMIATSGTMSDRERWARLMTRFDLHVLSSPPIRQAVQPETVYIVRGNTLPHVIACAGEAYQFMLEARSEAARVDGSMIVHTG